MKGWKRLTAAALVLQLTVSLTACQFSAGANHLEEVYEPAYENCLEQVETLFPEKVLNTSMVTVRHLRQEERGRVVLLEDLDPEYFTEHTEHHWVFLIGNADGFDYVQMVCSSTTNELIGYLTVE